MFPLIYTHLSHIVRDACFCCHLLCLLINVFVAFVLSPTLFLKQGISCLKKILLFFHVSSMFLPQNRQKLANLKWLIEDHLEPEGLVEKDSFHTFNQKLIKIYVNAKRFILTIYFFPLFVIFLFFLKFLYGKLFLYEILCLYLASVLQHLVQQVSPCLNSWVLL